MNVSDASPSEALEGDKLELIFQRQHELRERYKHIEAAKDLLPMMSDEQMGDLDLALVQAHLKDFAWRITEELGEACNCLKNKPWKQSELPTDRVHFMEEIADAFHFFIELCDIAGLDANSLFDIYMRKAEVNKFRQRSQY